jgi:hypothetical protein
MFNLFSFVLSVCLITSLVCSVFFLSYLSVCLITPLVCSIFFLSYCLSVWLLLWYVQSFFYHIVCLSVWLLLWYVQSFFYRIVCLSDYSFGMFNLFSIVLSVCLITPLVCSIFFLSYCLVCLITPLVCSIFFLTYFLSVWLPLWYVQSFFYRIFCLSDYSFGMFSLFSWTYQRSNQTNRQYDRQKIEHTKGVIRQTIQKKKDWTYQRNNQTDKTKKKRKKKQKE